MGRDKKEQPENVEFLTPTTLQTFSVEHIKNAYICEGLTPKELSEKFYMPVPAIEALIQENKLDELRNAHIKHGLSQLQNVQVAQAQKLMDLESNFKRMRIMQLEKTLEDYMAYYSRHGHFYKVHPVTLDILKDTNGIPMQLPIPNVTRELMALKETVNLSEGLKMLLGQIDAIINKPKDVQNLSSDVIDVTNGFDALFKNKRNSPQDDDE